MITSSLVATKSFLPRWLSHLLIHSLELDNASDKAFFGLPLRNPQGACSRPSIVGDMPTRISQRCRGSILTTSPLDGLLDWAGPEHVREANTCIERGVDEVYRSCHRNNASALLGWPRSRNSGEFRAEFLPRGATGRLSTWCRSIQGKCHRGGTSGVAQPCVSRPLCKASGSRLDRDPDGVI